MTQLLGSARPEWLARATGDDTIVVEASPCYVAGLPLLVVATFHRRASAPHATIIDIPYGLGIAVEPLDGQRTAIHREPRQSTEPGRGRWRSAPGGETRVLVDLSAFEEDLELEPGHYAVSLVVRDSWHPGHLLSRPITIEVRAASSADLDEITRLRALSPRGPRGSGLSVWPSFVLANGHTVVLSPGIGADAARQLALHAFLHRALYAPEDLAHLDPSWLDKIRDPLIQPEVGLFRYELYQARNHPDAATLRADLVGRFPGLAPELDDIDKGTGLVRMLRRGFGREGMGQRAAAQGRPYE